MNAVATDIIPVRTRTKQKSFLEVLNIKSKVDDWKFTKVWADRNMDNGDLIIDTLEINPTVIDQYMFVEEDKQLLSKLERIGFKELTKYPNHAQFDSFSYVMYNDKYNVAISVYDPKMKNVIKTAEEIAKETEFEYDYNLKVFLSTVKVLNK